MKYTNIDIVETLETYSRINIRGIELLVSNEDIPRLSKYRWYPDTAKIVADNLYYFKARIFYNDKYKYISMHRFILEAWEYDKQHVVDHINMDSRDNRRENLRLVDFSTNVKNARKNKEKYIECNYQHYSQFDRINKVMPMKIKRLKLLLDNNGKRETIVRIDNNTYKVITDLNLYFSRANKFGYPGLSYDKQHKKIAVIHERKKYGFFSDIEDALKQAYLVYKIPYEVYKL